MSGTDPVPVETPPLNPPAPTPPAPPAPAPAPAPAPVDHAGISTQIREAIAGQTETIIGGVREALSSVAPAAPAPTPTPTPQPTPTAPTTAPQGAVDKGPGKFASWFLGLSKAGE